MKLSQLVRYSNYLDNHSPDRTISESSIVNRYFNDLFHTIQTHELQFPGVHARMALVKNDINKSFEAFDGAIVELKKLVKANIEIWEPTYFKSSHSFYEQNFKNLTNEQILARRPILNPEVEDYIRSRLARYGDWQHPGMIIHPGLDNWIQQLVALDPLYLLDTNYELIDHCLKSFPAEYQARVRRYIMPETSLQNAANTSSTIHDSKIPHGQIGVILIYNYFNYRPLDFIIRCMRQLSIWLKPGGSVLFTFNNCDRASAVELVENDSACYTPGRLLLSGIQSINFEITHTYDINASTMWVEARKFGEFTSQRAGQSLARIVAKATRNQ